MIGMEIKSFDDFVITRHELKFYYILLSYNEKREYKEYIYNLPYKESVKDTMWCYLNEIAEEIIYEFELLNLYNTYKRNKQVIYE